MNSEGIPHTERMELIWERSIRLTSALYCIFGGSIGRRFTTLMVKEMRKPCFECISNSFPLAKLAMVVEHNLENNLENHH